MPKTVSIKEIQELDRLAIEDFHVPSLILMENAGRAVADVAQEYCNDPARSTVSVFCGIGNNAGDGFVAARHLLNAGVDVRVLCLGDRQKLKPDAAVNCQILENCSYPLHCFDKFDDRVGEILKESDLIIDALFGVGLSREIEDPYKEVILQINRSGKEIVSVDIPSGLNGDTGEIYGFCVKATVTVTFTFAKKGFCLGQGSEYTGRVCVADIGIPRRLFKE